MSGCKLGKHDAPSKARKLYWICEDCLETYARNHNEIARQGELDRELTQDLRRGAAYRLIPYYAITLAFIGFLLAFFL